MLSWGFLEILFLRSWLNSWIRLLPIPELPPWASALHGMRVKWRPALEVRGLADCVLDL